MDIALRLTERVESWFGSVEQFRDRVVWVSKIVMVDCVGYPYLVFSRQCQVFPYSTPSVSVIAPFSSIVILHNIARSQGLQAWWRGWYSHIFLMVSQRFSLTVLDRLVSPPRVSGSWWSKSGSFLSHYSFRGLAYFSTYPLLSFNILEMVQNLPHKVYSGGLLEVINDRPLISVDSHHRLPYLYLAAPIILRGFATELVFLYCQRLVSRIVRRPTDPSDTLAVVMHGLWVAYFGSFLSETVLYPLETVVARMTCQGMPVLVDNVQTGLDISFVTTFYRGFGDCVAVIWESEGVFGFFRGYSALLLRYLLHGGLLFLLWRIERAANAKMREIQR
jgi:hypothetical protein